MFDVIRFNITKYPLQTGKHLLCKDFIKLVIYFISFWLTAIWQPFWKAKWSLPDLAQLVKIARCKLLALSITQINIQIPRDNSCIEICMAGPYICRIVGCCYIVKWYYQWLLCSLDADVVVSVLTKLLDDINVLFIDVVTWINTHCY